MQKIEKYCEVHLLRYHLQKQFKNICVFGMSRSDIATQCMYSSETILCWFARRKNRERYINDTAQRLTAITLVNRQLQEDAQMLKNPYLRRVGIGSAYQAHAVRSAHCIREGCGRHGTVQV